MRDCVTCKRGSDTVNEVERGGYYHPYMQHCSNISSSIPGSMSLTLCVTESSGGCCGAASDNEPSTWAHG